MFAGSHKNPKINFDIMELPSSGELGVRGLGCAILITTYVRFTKLFIKAFRVFKIRNTGVVC